MNLTPPIIQAANTMESSIIELQGDVACITVDEKVYGMPAILKAAYSFTDKCYILFSSSQKGLNVYLSQLDESKKDALDSKEIAKSFCNALLEQKMREQVLLETGNLREIITTRAFLSGNIDIAEDE